MKQRLARNKFPRKKLELIEAIEDEYHVSIYDDNPRKMVCQTYTKIASDGVDNGQG